ncbi:MAG: SHOCT domain-containing protein [Ilumatobacteraceae bacterium]
MFWTFLWFFLWIAWLFLLFRVFADIFRSHDLGGWGKALWSIFIILVPFLGTLVYVIARGSGMHERDLKQAKAQQDAFQDYVRQAAAPSGAGAADELTKLADLRDKGVISAEEFEQQKAKLLV